MTPSDPGTRAYTIREPAPVSGIGDLEMQTAARCLAYYRRFPVTFLGETLTTQCLDQKTNLRLETCRPWKNSPRRQRISCLHL